HGLRGGSSRLFDGMKLSNSRNIETSGVAHFLAHDDAECLSMLRELLSFIPSNNLDDPPRKPCSDPIDRAEAALDTLVPAQSNQPYDIKDVIRAVVDDGYF